VLWRIFMTALAQGYVGAVVLGHPN
jgi:hypothetical protein